MIYLCPLDEHIKTCRYVRLYLSVYPHSVYYGIWTLSVTLKKKYCNFNALYKLPVKSWNVPF